jgi:hypothetical protein
MTVAFKQAMTRAKHLAKLKQTATKKRHAALLMQEIKTILRGDAQAPETGTQSSQQT